MAIFTSKGKIPKVRVSIITATFNCSDTIEDCLSCVQNQSYHEIEKIIIDGGSTDGTLEVIKRYKDKVDYWISEPDRGIYDALNKGIRMARGDVIGILHSDDLFADNFVVETVVDCFFRNSVDSCYGDLVYVSRDDTKKVVRYWKAGEFKREKFKYGWMPPHPTFFCKRHIYERYGLLNLNFPLAADYELMFRFLYRYNVSTAYIPKVLVKMRTGGTSRPGSYTVKSVLENYKAWKINGLNYPPTMLFKPLLKIRQLIPNNGPTI